MFIYCDLLGKRWFPYYKHTLILAVLQYFTVLIMKNSTAVWKFMCEFKKDFYPFVFPSLSGNLCKMAPGCKKWLFLLQLEKWASPEYPTKGHSFCKQCLHNFQFMKTRFSWPNLSKLARADISCQFMKTRSLCRHCLQNEWTLAITLLTYTVKMFAINQ